MADPEANGLRRYEVEIRETYRKRVVVYARNLGRAEELADQLCDCGAIDMDKNCYDGRDFDTCASHEPYDSKDPDVYVDDEQNGGGE